MYFTIIIPVYNNQTTIANTIDRLNKNIPSEKYKAEFLFIDDGSSDESIHLLKLAAKTDPRIKTVEFDNNYGQLAAIYAGIKLSSSTYTILISADLQEEDCLIERYVRQTEEHKNADLFIGLREHNSDYILFRFFSKLFYKLVQLQIRQMPDGGFDTFCIYKDLKEKFIESFEKTAFGQLSLIELSNQIIHVPYKRKKSATNKLYLRSILFKISYFYSCLKYVYFERNNENKIRPPFYKIIE